MKTFALVPKDVQPRRVYGLRYSGRGVCWMCDSSRRTPATHECVTVTDTGKATMIVCDFHWRQWQGDTKAKVRVVERAGNGV